MTAEHLILSSSTGHGTVPSTNSCAHFVPHHEALFEITPLTSPAQHFDIAIIGTGPVGLTAALVLAKTGLHVALVGPAEQPQGRHEDQRTAALFAGSIELLRNLEIWPSCEDECAQLKGIRMLDGRRALLRAPEVVFHARDVGIKEFGYNVPNRTLTRSLWQHVRATSDAVTIIETEAVRSIDQHDAQSVIHLAEGGQVTTPLLVGADGRKSICRASAGIRHKTWTYPQTAIACTFHHTRAHQDISTEFHHHQGPLTVVPMPGKASSLVWVTSPDEAASLRQMNDDGFANALEAKLNGLLGDISTLSQRAAFPLSALTADVFGANGVALVGEAAHVIPPIGAQGLNLGLRDCAVLADCVASAIAEGANPADQRTLSAYNQARDFDIRSRTNAVDIFNRSLLTAFLPAHLVRGVGMHAVKSFAPLRRWMVREGLTPTGVSPNLMQSEGVAKFKQALSTSQTRTHANRNQQEQSPVHS